MLEESYGVRAISLDEVMAETPVKTMLERLASTYHRYPGEGKIWIELNDFLQYGRIGRDKKRPTRSIYIVGESGAAKSFTIEEWARHYPVQKVGDKKQYPVIVVSIPANATIKGVNAAINRAFGLKPFLAHTGVEQQQTPEVIERIKDAGVLLIIFDEAQHALDKSDKVIVSVRRHLVHLANVCGASIAICVT